MIYILLPAYNEETSLPSLFKKIKDVMDRQKYEYRFIVVNDGSSDNTQEVLERHASFMPIHVIRHKINRGLGETARNMFEEAAEIARPDDIFIRMDADDTHDPNYIPSMVKKISEGYDVVIASRFQEGGGMLGVSPWRAFVSRCANRIMSLFFPIKGVREYSCGFRAYRAEAVQDAIRIFGNYFIDLKGLGFTGTVEKLIKFQMMGANIAEVPFVLRYDQKKSTSKMLASITTLGYLILLVKYLYPWGVQGKEWQRKIRELKHRRAAL